MKYRAISENHLYSKVYAKGKKFVTSTSVIYVLNDYHASRLQKENPLKKRINRIGITVTKKNGGAVTRNRIKRIFREAYKQIDCEYNIKKGFLIVLVAREAAIKTKTQDIKKDFYTAFLRLTMI